MLAHRWRLPKVFVALLLTELPLTVVCLLLFGIAQGDTYQTKLWENGYVKGFNSSPNEAAVPLIWSSYMLDYNVVVSVFSMFLLLVKSVMYILHIWIPLLSAIVSGLEVALYSTSLSNQSAPDMSDPQQPNPGLAWYLSKGCSYATEGNYSYCMQARAAYGTTCVMVALFSVYFLVSIHSCWITKEEKTERLEEREFDLEMKRLQASSAAEDEMTRQEKWETNRQIFMNLPKTPTTAGFGLRSPMTPRTVAFTQLNGGPAPKTPVVSVTPKGPTGGLKFREQYGD
ncbi:MAG: hypothetical protein FE78DRAFT_144283 [Acidomyces sp. 'richmondensis']|nr:MAG: hypothetical protein FE78DRAFT_144283 [Acidomyces sp. 'richmondensis']